MLERWQAGERQQELSFLLSNFWLPDAQHSLDSRLSGCIHQTKPEKLSIELKNAQGCNRHQVGQTVAHWRNRRQGVWQNKVWVERKASKGPGAWIRTGTVSGNSEMTVRARSGTRVKRPVACKTGGRGAIKGDFHLPSNRGISTSQMLVKGLSGCSWQAWMW